MTTAEKVLAKLQAYRLKEEHPNQYRCNSPLRGNSDSFSFVLKVDLNGEHGTYYDHVTSESGSLYKLAELLGVETPTLIPVATTKRIYSGLDDYAAAHGIPGDELRAWNWRETRKDNRSALEFTTPTGKRWRFLDGEKPTYKSQTGYKACWYGLNSKLFDRLRAGQPLVICNGEISTITGQYYGLAACCVTGGERSLSPTLIEELKRVLA